MRRSDRPSTTTEIVIGRTFAMMVHPYAAWRTRSAKGRAVVVASYIAAGYAVVLALLFFTAPNGAW